MSTPQPIQSAQPLPPRAPSAPRGDVAAKPAAAPSETLSVEQAIASAARQTSIDFDFLIAQAQVESSMDPNARARTSSATGLYQFIESTWLETMQRHGDRFGLGEVASTISTAPNGKAFIADNAQREAVLALRADPQIASFMAAGLAEDNRAHLAPILGRQPEHAELYLAHFLGAGGAGRFLSAMHDNPDQSAAQLFQRPAAANRAIFYGTNGSQRSLAEVMNVLSAKLEQGYANSGVSGGAGVIPNPYIIANGGALGPASPPIITGRERVKISPERTLSLPASLSPGAPSGGLGDGVGVPDPRPPLSNVLRDTFTATGTGTAGDQSTAQVKRAYNQLRAFGL